MFPKLLVGCVVSVALASPWLISTQSDTSRAESPDAEIKTEPTAPANIGTMTMVDYDEQYEIEQVEIAAYLAALEEQRKIDEYLAAVEAERIRQEQEAARSRSQPSQNTAALMGPSAPNYAAGSGGITACIRQRESGGNYAINTGNGYFGAYQFTPGTWNNAVSGAGHPEYANGRADLAPPEIQDAAFWWLFDQPGGPRNWPNTSVACY